MELRSKLIEKILGRNDDTPLTELAESLGIDLDSVLEAAIMKALESMTEVELLELL